MEEAEALSSKMGIMVNG